jgi:ribonuclease D
MPSENLITPEFVRRVCWDQTKAELSHVEDKLRKLGARPWQIEQVAPLLASALTQTEPLVIPEEKSEGGEEPSA